MYNADKFKNKASRSTPSQARGKERVRVILAAALTLYKERGMESVTTNDIAERAAIPIGSLYRYFPNKDAIAVALTELYIEDIAKIFEEIHDHPMLEQLSWEEILLLLVDGWVNYSRLNGPYAFLYAGRSDPKLRIKSQHMWEGLLAAFSAVLLKRCSLLSPRQILVCFRLVVAAAEMGIDDDYRIAAGGQDVQQEAVTAIALYLTYICGSQDHHSDVILS